MKRFTWFGAVALALSACAPAQSPAAAPSPAPAAPAAAPAPVAPAPAAAAGVAADTAPRNWFLLDAQTDGFPGISAERAYREVLANRTPKRTVVVAILDSGTDPRHPDLDGVLWVNAREVAGNGKDDDGNGYIDDVNGWNFIGGRDGRNVHQDTYEVTRLYATLKARCGAATGTAATTGACAQWPVIRTAFEARRTETMQMLEQIQNIEAASQRFATILRQHLGTDSLTVERVTAIQADRPDLQQARGAYLQLAAAGITPELIAREKGTVEEHLRYSLNPDFEPRPIVGDNYANVSQRGYGNPDVRGPTSDHGTHVAGIVGAERGNGLGVDGVAAAVRLMPVRVVPDGDERDKDVANGIRYAVDNGANIINMSFGKAFSPQKRVVDEAVRYAESKGVLLVHAAGNDASDLNTGANFPNQFFEGGGVARTWIEVGASSWKVGEQLAAPFSNYGKGKVDVFAPGVAILSTLPEGEYGRNQGTSMAAPVVSGLAAMLMAYYPELSAVQVRQIILDSATRYTDQRSIRPGSEAADTRFGDFSNTGGVVNALAAVRMAEQMSGRPTQ